MTLRQAAERLLAELPDVPEVQAAVLRCSAPWLVVVIGRRSAGKTTLVNRLAGVSLPTGLGGVTLEPVEVPYDQAILIDTVGIGGRGALDRLMPRLQNADAVLWVVDGLHPLTLTERRTVRECLRPGTSVTVVVTHLDVVDPDDVDDILARVRHLVRPLGGEPVVRADLRTRPVPEGLVRVQASSPRRRAALRAASDAAARALDERGAARVTMLREEVLSIWRECVSGTRKTLEATIDGGVVHTGVLLDRLGVLADEAVGEAMRELSALDRPADLGLLVLPRPRSHETTLMGEVLGAWGGREGAWRVMRARMAQWLVDGQLAIEEWLEGSTVLADEVARRSRGRTAVAEARAALAGGRR